MIYSVNKDGYSVGIGRVSQIPEKKTTQSGKELYTFSVQVGKKDDKVPFIQCAIWGDSSMASYIQLAEKGDQIRVEGVVKSRVYNEKTYYDMTVEFVTLAKNIIPIVPQQSANTEQPLANLAENFEEIELEEGELPF